MREKMCEFKVSAMLRWWWWWVWGGGSGSRVLKKRFVKFSKQNKMLHDTFSRL